MPEFLRRLNDKRVRRGILAGALLALGMLSMRETAHHLGLVSMGLVLGAAIASWWD